MSLQAHEMKYDSDTHHRRSIRLKGYDYSQAGAYFVTICSQNKECLFGDVVDSEIRLNDAGQMVHRIWNDLSIKYPDIELEEFFVMPNHMHGIIVFVGAPLVGAHFPCTAIDNAESRAGTRLNPGQAQDLPLHWGMLSVNSNQLQRIDISMASDNTIGHHSMADYGSAIITSTSSAMRKKWTASANT